MWGVLAKALLDSLFGAVLKAIQDYRREQQLKELGHAAAVEEGRKEREAALERMEAAANSRSPADAADRLRNGTF